MVAAVAAGGAALSAPAPARAETLTEALAAAYAGNPTLLAARRALQATHEQRPQALSGWLPTVTLSQDETWRVTDSNLDALGGSPTGGIRDTARSLDVRQNLYRGGTDSARLDQAENTILQRTQDLRTTEQRVLLEAAAAYNDVLRDRAVVDVRRNQVQVLEQHLRVAEEKLRVGDATLADQAQASSRLAQARAALHDAEAALATSEARYEQVVGHPPPANMSLPTPPPGLPGSAEEARQRALEANPEVASAAHAEDAARDSVLAERGQLLPRVDLSASFTDGRSYMDTLPQLTDARSIGVRVAVPLYQGGLVHARVREAKEVVGQRRMELLATQRRTVQEAERAWQDLTAARGRVEELTRQVEFATVAADTVSQEVDLGRRLLLDLLDAEQELLNARIALIAAERDRLVNGYALKSATGGLDAGTLGLPVELYDPSVHYQETRWKLFGVGDFFSTDPE